MDFGNLIEGVVELDPISGRLVINTRDEQGRVITFDPQLAMARYLGQEVRFTLASFEALDEMARLVEEGDLLIEEAVVGGRPG